MPVLSLSLLSRHIYGIDFKIIGEFLHELTHSQDLLKTWPLTFTLTSRLQSLWYQFQNIAKFPSYHTHNLRCPHCSPTLPFMVGGKKPHPEEVAHRPLTSRCPNQAWDHHLCKSLILHTKTLACKYSAFAFLNHTVSFLCGWKSLS